MYKQTMPEWQPTKESKLLLKGTINLVMCQFGYHKNYDPYG